ncbi:MAG: N-acetylmuramoyl-L-alanine amidase [Nitrospiria bacterium]
MMKRIGLLFVVVFHFFLGMPSCTAAETGGLQDSEALLLVHRAKNKTRPSAVIEKIRHSNNPDHSRVVIDLSRPVSYKANRHTASQTIVLELSGTRLGDGFKGNHVLAINGSIVRKVEAKESGKGKVLIDLRYKRLGAHKIMLLKKPDRLVLDLYPPTSAPPSFTIHTIVIDPGHGGKDPGATSKSGLKEKEVVLDVSRRLKTLIQKRLNKKVILTRNRDIFIPLKKRTQIANRNRADLFISVHVNSSPLRHTKGIEVYLLGRASDKGAMATAARENAASDGESFDFQEMIFNDLEREFTMNASLELAHFTNESIVKNLISKYPTAALGVKRAPFFVLAHTDMPAILAEISFLSNRIEEKRLRTKGYRKAVAESLYKGVEAYIQSLQAGS